MKSSKFTGLILLLVSVLVLQACNGKETGTNAAESKTAETKTKETTTVETTLSAGEKESSEASKADTSSSEEMTEISQETETENPEETTSRIPYGDRFFGKDMSVQVAEINRKTISHPESMLFDILSEASFSGEKIRKMVESYSFPKTDLLGGVIASEDTKTAILNNRNVGSILSGDVSVRYAIITNTADVRSFPTELSAVYSTDANCFDYFQESAFNLAEGVIILHESSDGGWYFVQGNNYYGWIRKRDAALCDRETFVSYLTTDEFLITVTHKEGDPLYRLGTIVPYRKITLDSVILQYPERQEDGSLCISDRSIPLSDLPAVFSQGFLAFDTEDLARRAETLLGTAYGWGDTDGHYDCSSTVGLLYRCYGIYLPRNTGILKYAGGNVADAGLLTYEEKQKLIGAHTGCLVVIPGHVMLASGTRFDGVATVHDVIHNTTGWYSFSSAEAVLVPQGKIVKSSLEDMYHASGVDYIDRTSYIIWFD